MLKKYAEIKAYRKYPAYAFALASIRVTEFIKSVAELLVKQE